MKISGNIVDVIKEEIYPGYIVVENGRIQDIVRENLKSDKFILPGFIDSHIHIESSMLLPYEFARIASTHGTVACVADPHEIANVLGRKGVEFMHQNAQGSAIKVYFGVPSCVPATNYETAGGKIDIEDIKYLFEKYDLKFLGEMMNVPSVIYNDENVAEKIEIAKKLNRKIDGHAPKLRGADLKKYIEAGIVADHESVSIEEAEEKINLGMKIQIRQGSAAQDFSTLYPLFEKYPDYCMFCSDDLHPDNLVDGHINLLVKKSVELGVDIFKVLKAATLNPVKHYGLDVGLLQVGDSADFIVVSDLKNFEVLRTYINGEIVARNGRPEYPYKSFEKVNNFKKYKLSQEDFQIKSEKDMEVNVITVHDNSLITSRERFKINSIAGELVADTSRDTLKIAVVNRYEKSKPAVGFIKNFGLKSGAIASSVAHDSHNIVAVGCDNDSLCRVVNLIMENEGGISASDGVTDEILPLSFAGIMSGDDGYNVAKMYKKLDVMAKNMGSKLTSPFMTLSFMALLVIPDLKMSDKGLFDSQNFKFIGL
ncbi:adenine deaminase [Deferribacterales bacterium Es71-Z0220]|uniref:adenine deaminase n=1 Tax=Deferrivibrio essentukiensis TaxID=2880922 RepID=UPI001F60AC35|nr:adenine deaminase [Deferrivibrio essentukiensis]